MPRLRILPAEDDPNDITLLRHALKRNGIAAQVQVVADGDQAIKYLRREGKYADRAAFPFPDLLLLDQKMPLISGVEVLEWLRHQPECANLPVVMLSGSGLQADIEEAYRLGVRTYFMKPHSVTELGDLLRLIVGYWSHSQRPQLFCKTAAVNH